MGAVSAQGSISGGCRHSLFYPISALLMTSEEENKCLGKYHLSVLKEIKLDNKSNLDTVQNL